MVCSWRSHSIVKNFLNRVQKYFNWCMCKSRDLRVKQQGATILRVKKSYSRAVLEGWICQVLTNWRETQRFQYYSFCFYFKLITLNQLTNLLLRWVRASKKTGRTKQLFNLHVFWPCVYACELQTFFWNFIFEYWKFLNGCSPHNAIPYVI